MSEARTFTLSKAVSRVFGHKAFADLTCRFFSHLGGPPWLEALRNLTGVQRRMQKMLTA
jgi:hypothetical protein